MSCKICWHEVNDGRQKLLQDKYGQNCTYKSHSGKISKTNMTFEDKNEMQSEFTPHIQTMCTCATILAINSIRNSDWYYTKYTVA